MLGAKIVQFKIKGVWLKRMMHIVHADVPLLISLADKGRLAIKFDNLEITGIHNPSKAL